MTTAKLIRMLVNKTANQTWSIHWEVNLCQYFKLTQAFPIKNTRVNSVDIQVHIEHFSNVKM